MALKKDKVIHWLLQFCLAQLVVTLISLPLLIAWGLPLSYMTPVSNLIFTPILSAFISLSTLLFICELLSIPAGWIIYLLTKLTDLWLFVLNFGSIHWLFGITCHHQILLWLCTLGTIALLFITQYCTLKRQVLYFGIYLAICLVYFNLIAPPHFGTHQMTKNKASLIIKRKDGATYIDDQGLLQQRINQRSWAVFTFRPTLLKFTGSLSIEDITCNHINPSTLQTLLILFDYTIIKQITLNLTKTQAKKNKALLELLSKKSVVHNTYILLNYETPVWYNHKKMGEYHEKIYSARAAHTDANTQHTSIDNKARNTSTTAKFKR
ncbi:hypothetical protein A3F06_00820 [candidate division TM6 bacterium RIFCSPHIGHO2_12_FULL_36_22]|nr:MAG: hypothetical protein A3F06_00820 [candidate division TM6 bacterium RIFCSPHIGHO2_12_FULL_36_22]